MSAETAYPALAQSLPIPKMYGQHTSPGTDSSSSESPNSHSSSSLNTTPSSSFMQPWLNTVRNSPNATDPLSSSNLPTPPSMMQRGMNMMHPIYMYSSPYFHQYPHNTMYPYSSMYPSQGTTNTNPSQNVQNIVDTQKEVSPENIVSKEHTKISPFAPIPTIPQPHSYSHLTTTPVHQHIPRSDRRSSLSSECSSPSDTSVNRTDVSVDGLSTSDSDLSRTTDSGNSSLGSDVSTTISPTHETTVQPKPTEKPAPVVKTTPEPLYKKKARTNYTPEQVRGLEKVFLETPYPEPEAMEKLSKELEIPEQKLKVWFQNKRARWRRRVQDNKHLAATAVSSVYMPTMMSPYGFIPTPTMAPANPMMPGSYYAYQQAAAAANTFHNTPMQKYGFPCMY